MACAFHMGNLASGHLEAAQYNAQSLRLIKQNRPHPAQDNEAFTSLASSHENTKTCNMKAAGANRH